MFNTQRIASKRNAPQGKATRQTAVQTAVFRGVFTSTAMQGIEAQIGAMHRSAKQIGQPIAVGFSMCFHIKRDASPRTASNRRARQCTAAQGNSKQIGLAIGNSGFPDVFSHQTRRNAAHCTSVQRSEKQCKAEHSKAPRLGHSQECFRQVVLTHSAWETPAV